MRRDRHGIVKSGVSFENLEAETPAESRAVELEKENLELREEVAALRKFVADLRSLVRQALANHHPEVSQDVFQPILPGAVQHTFCSEAQGPRQGEAEGKASGEQASPAGN